MLAAKCPGMPPQSSIKGIQHQSTISGIGKHNMPSSPEMPPTNGIQEEEIGFFNIKVNINNQAFNETTYRK